MPGHVQIEQLRRIAEIDLIHVVVDRPARGACEMGNGEAVVGEAGEPEQTPEIGEVAHQMDFIDPRRVAHPLDGPHEDPHRAVMGGLGAEVDAHGWLDAGRLAMTHAEHQAIGRQAHAGRQPRPAVERARRYSAITRQHRHDFPTIIATGRSYTTLL